MQITYLGDDRFEIKTREAKTLLSSDGIDIEGYKISEPGEYERKGVSAEVYTPKNQSTIYFITTENITLCYPGLIRSTKLPDYIKQVDVDILFVTAGKENTLKAADSEKIVGEIDPKCVIPMLYDKPEDISHFKSKAAAELSSLKIKKNDLPEEERVYYILTH